MSTRVLYAAVGEWGQVPSSSWRWDGGLSHSELLSQVIEASDVVHAALAHHTSKLRVHLQAQPKLNVRFVCFSLQIHNIYQSALRLREQEFKPTGARCLSFSCSQLIYLIGVTISQAKVSNGFFLIKCILSKTHTHKNKISPLTFPLLLKASAYLCHIRKATGLKGIMGVAVQEARTKQSCATGGARGS